jgi:hypothetical protein
MYVFLPWQGAEFFCFGKLRKTAKGMWSGVGLFLYALVLDVERCADVVFSASIVVNVALLTYFCMLRY